MRLNNSKQPLSVLAATAVLSVCGAGLAQAETSVQLYGFVKADIQNVRISGPSGKASMTRLVDDLSVFGIRGTERISDNLTAFFQIETNAKITGVGTSSIGDRNTGVGLRGPWGEIRMGHWESPLRLTSAYLIDPFPASIFASNSIMGNGMATAGDGVAPHSFDRRQKRQLQYSTPNWNGVTVRLATSRDDQGTSGTPSSFSGSVSYMKNGLYLAWGHEYHRNYFYNGSSDHADRIALAYKFGNTRLAGSYERIRFQPAPGERLRRDAFQVAVTHDIGRHHLKASYVQALRSKGNATTNVGGTAAPGSGSGAKQFSIGYSYDFSKRTEIWGGMTHLKNNRNASFNLSTNGVPLPMTGNKATGIALGMTHKF